MPRRSLIVVYIIRGISSPGKNQMGFFLFFWQNVSILPFFFHVICPEHKNTFFSKKGLLFSFCYAIMYKLSGTPRVVPRTLPGVAKFGIALEWGSRGLEFESRHSDQSEYPYRDAPIFFFIFRGCRRTSFVLWQPLCHTCFTTAYCKGSTTRRVNTPPLASKLHSPR